MPSAETITEQPTHVPAQREQPPLGPILRRSHIARRLTRPRTGSQRAGQHPSDGPAVASDADIGADLTAEPPRSNSHRLRLADVASGVHRTRGTPPQRLSGLRGCTEQSTPRPASPTQPVQRARGAVGRPRRSTGQCRTDVGIGTRRSRCADGSPPTRRHTEPRTRVGPDVGERGRRCCTVGVRSRTPNPGAEPAEHLGRQLAVRCDVARRLIARSGDIHFGGIDSGDIARTAGRRPGRDPLPTRRIPERHPPRRSRGLT